MTLFASYSSQRKRRPVPALVLLVGFGLYASFMAETAQAAPKCKKSQRYVRSGSPLLDGPGLGFEVLSIQEKGACLPLLGMNTDGTFAMVRVSKEAVRWVATGLVDSDLSQEGTKVLPTKKTLPIVTAKAIVLRGKPRIDSPAKALVPKGTTLTQKGVSEDGQWLSVVHDSKTGWIPKYVVAEEAVKAGSAPSAGSGEWSNSESVVGMSNDERELRRRKMLEREAAREEAKQAASQKEKKNSSKTKTAKGTKKKTSKSKDAGKDPPPTPAVADGKKDGASEDATAAEKASILGQRPEAFVLINGMYWQQNYNSDASTDPFGQYAVSAPLGTQLDFGYRYRNKFPLVVGVEANFGATGLSAADPLNPAGAGFVFVSHARLRPELGWRAITSEDVDIEAGVMLLLDGTLALGGPTDAQGNGLLTVPTSVGYGGGPYLRTRGRLLGGALGLVTATVSVGVGGYNLFPMPGGNYFDAVANDCAAGIPVRNVTPPSVQKQVDGDPAANVQPDPTADDYIPALAGCPEDVLSDANPRIHFNVSADLKLRYAYPVTDSLTILAEGHIRFRQAYIRGAGIRNPGPEPDASRAYTEASSLDAAVTTGIGAAWTF